MNFRALRRCACATILSVSVAACDALTSVDAPDVVEPSEYASAAGATALAASAITEFHVVFAGNSDSRVTSSGAMADELLATSTGTNPLVGGLATWDSRDPQDPSFGSNARPYTTLQLTRQRLLDAIRSFQRVAPDSGARIGQLFALLGYTSVFFGEDFCAGVPLSHRDALLRPVYGAPLTTAQLFDSALMAFDSALVYGVDSMRILNLARVGRGRALLNQGRFSEAGLAVAGVPTNYVYNVTYLAVEALRNGFFRLSGVPLWSTAFTVPQREGTNGLDWRTANDPRVQLINRGLSPGVTDTVYGFVPYQTATAPVRLAGGVEARLIEAEAALQAGNTASWLSILNNARATGITPAMPALADPGTPTGRVDLMFRERAFWMFLTGHRLGDLRRLVRQYGRSAETVYPTGTWRDGLPYGSATSMAPPPSQQNNPNYSGCLNRDA